MATINGLTDFLRGEQTAVHIGVTPLLAQHVLTAARAEGFDCHDLDVSTVSTPQEYYDLLGTRV